MSVNGCVKGKVAEREVVHILQPVATAAYSECGRIPPKLKRNPHQSASGGYDLLGLDEWLAIEVKWRKQLSVPSWWAQTVQQAHAGGKQRIPVLFYRKNGVPYTVRLPGSQMATPWANVRDIDVTAFQWWLYDFLKRELQRAAYASMH